MNNLNATPVSSRLHIGIFGRRNAGKSSLINFLTNQSTALVSPIPGTTTDPVFKTMEILPLGPVVLIDTAGIDDKGNLGKMRMKRSYDILNSTELAILVVDAEVGVTDFELKLLNKIRKKEIPVIGVLNKVDLQECKEERREKWQESLDLKLVEISALQGIGKEILMKEIIKYAPNDSREFSLVGDLVNPGDFVVLVVPIDNAAPKGRLILPQQQVIRDLLDHDALAVVTKEYKLKYTIQNLEKKPALVITDSQVFQKVASETPKDINLTSFSILMARHKGDLIELVKGAKAIEKLKPGSRVLISEACGHHRQTDDIGSVKIPRWLSQSVGGDINFNWVSGKGFPNNLKEYDLVVHCGACMLNRKEMLYRLSIAKEEGVAIINYGVLIAYLHGILPRALQPFPMAKRLFNTN